MQLDADLLGIHRHIGCRHAVGDGEQQERNARPRTLQEEKAVQ